MEKKIIEEILRIKKLMSENQTSNNFIIEQGNIPKAYLPSKPTPATLSPQTNLLLQPVSTREQDTKQGFIVDPCGVPEVPTQKFLDGSPIPRNSVDYRQEATTRATLFNSLQDVMECWDFQLFDENSNAANSMYLGDQPIYLDSVNGYYFFADESQQVRIYLPKDEFFKSMAGKVKSIIAYNTCKEACSSKNSNPVLSKLYTVLYNLKDPKKAMLTTIMTATGPVPEDSGDPSRGWAIDYSAVRSTGYFGVGEAIGKETFSPSDFTELSLENYGEQFARSQFDIWYDSVGGTALSIGVAIGVSMLSEGTLAPLMLDWVASQGARTLGVFLIKQAAEYAIAIPEFIYLKERGMDSQAAFILLLAHIPVFESLWIQPKFKLDRDIIYGQTTELLNRYRQGSFKTPADFKNYLKSLPEQERIMMETVFKTVGDELIKNPNLFRKSFAEELQFIVRKVNKGELDKAQRAFTRLSNTHKFVIPTTSQSLIKGAKIFGAIMFPAFGIQAGLTELIEENPIVKDPAKLGRVVQALELLPELLNSEQANILKVKEQEYKEMISASTRDQNYALLVAGTTGLLKILEDTDKVIGSKIKLTNEKSNQIESAKGKITSEFVSLYLGFIISRIVKEKYDSYTKGNGGYSAIASKVEKSWSMVIIDQTLYTDFCTDITLVNPPKTKQESCLFRDWVVKNHKEFKFEGPLPDKTTGLKQLTLCPVWERNFKFTDDFYLKECGFKYAWVSYYKEYLKLNKKNVGSTALSKQPPQKPQ